MTESPAPHMWDCATGVPGMLKNNLSGRYYSRIQVGGKRMFRSLKTTVWSVAKLRHLDKVAAAQRQRQKKIRLVEGRGLMGDIADRHREEYHANTSLSEKSKIGFQCDLDRIVLHWGRCFGTDFRKESPANITEERARRFANYLHGEATWRRKHSKAHTKGFGAVTVNKTIELLHRILRVAVACGYVGVLPFELDPVVGGPIRKTERRKKLRLPSSAKMQEVFAQMRVIDYMPPDDTSELMDYLIDRAAESADFAEFMAYSGARRGEAEAFVWEDDLKDSVIIRGTKSESSEDREVPKIPALRELLARIRAKRQAASRSCQGRVFAIKQCREAIATACRKVGIERLTHHSLRHFFATICIESGVDIPTISRWLGHADGGVLAMQTYGHLRTEHSFAAAAKVTLMSA